LGELRKKAFLCMLAPTCAALAGDGLQYSLGSTGRPSVGIAVSDVEFLAVLAVSSG
jgi:hypothetical protein